eukprot:CAMPEP_0176438384 /NCGR_PEP_ID=MMETSP0127-20121128/19249_1 /TAXON_ID=938130 /ORGANISM="Platyophrya macrostoma, Strain WH" /LENGTH=484 /DNA_ID=CAMNT_0017822319 /DNA_START=148 /DNA_END=1602 /DNA_ORIENTATION=+
MRCFALGVLALVCSVLLSGLASADSKVWQLAQGDIGVGTQSVLFSKDGSTVWSLWSVNQWAPYPYIFLLSLDAATGRLQWNGTLFGRQASNQQYTLSEGSEAVYVANVFGGNVTSLRKSDGAVLWNVVPFPPSYGYGSLTGVTESHDLVFVSATLQTVTLERSSGAALSSYHTQGSSAAPVVVANETGGITVVVGTYQVSASILNGTILAPVWTIPSTTLLDADADVTLVGLSAGVGVPQMSLVNTNSGEFLLNVTFFNTQMSIGWGALFRHLGEESGLQMAAVSIGNSLMGVNLVTGAVAWQQSFGENMTSWPIRYNATHLAVSVQAGSTAVVTLFRVTDGAAGASVETAASFDMWYETEQTASSSVSHLVAMSVTTTSTTPYSSVLRVVSLDRVAPVGVIVQEFAPSLTCGGSFGNKVLPTGCVAEGSGSVQRSCLADGSGVEVSVFSNNVYCQGAASSTTSYTSGTCYPTVDGSFRITSCH